MGTIYQRAQFLQGTAKFAGLPPDEGVEVAFAGRSNAGKSSAINALTGRKGLARTSKTPGRTQEINFFLLDEERRLVDLPGYGFAKAPLPAKKRWAALVEGYLQRRESLQGVVLLTDVRRPLTTLDQQLLGWCESAGLPVQVVLTKADKLSRAQQHKALAEAAAIGREYSTVFEMQVFSATKATGIKALAAVLDGWLNVVKGKKERPG